MFFGSNFVFSIVKVGEEVAERFETPHPYPAVKGVVWEKEFHWPNAGYIAIHFSEFNLAKGDYMEISSPDGKFYYTFSEKGKKVKHWDRTEELSDFWGTHIPGDKAIVRLAWVYQSNPGIRYQTGSPGRYQSTQTWSGGMPDPFGSGSQSSYLYSIYATYNR